MRVHVEHRWASNRMDVTVYREARDGVEVLRPAPAREPGEFPKNDEWEFVPSNVDLPAMPTYSFHTGVLEQIVAAASNVLPPSAATDRHLKDAIEVRDRLLKLVEAS